ncbi:hypothetical protein BHE74_00024350 [Ensete ventricosum]|nr:hypothetical protein BHE74_00024350 [Ensete ventricosum]
MRSCPVRDTIMQRYDQELLGAPLWCTTQQEEGLWIQGVNVVVLQRQIFVCASEFALDESLSHQHMGAVHHRGRSPTAGELDYFSAHIRLREPDKSEDKAEGETSVESSIPCSHRGRALIVKGANEVENAKGNSKYQDKAEW